MQPRDLSTHEPYEAGRGVAAVAREHGRDPETVIALSSNENPFGPSPAAVDALRSAAETMHGYPKAAHVDLVAAIAPQWAVDPEQVWLANGGDGAIDYLSRAFLDPGDRVLVPDPGFAYYAMSARFHHGAVATYPLSVEDDFAQTPERILERYDGERIVYLTSPHNPVGTTIGPDDVAHIARETADETLVVVDEAYGEFAETESAISVITGSAGIEPRSDVAVIRTFSKAYGLAGLRLGFAVVPSDWANAYARVNTPFAASTAACVAGLAALEDESHVDRTVDAARWARSYVADAVDRQTWAGEGNFVLVDVGDAGAVTAALAARGIVVRDCTSFGLPQCIRISCGTESEMKRAVESLIALLRDRSEADGDWEDADESRPDAEKADDDQYRSEGADDGDEDQDHSEGAHDEEDEQEETRR